VDGPFPERRDGLPADRVAVVGGGLFGVTIAVALANSNCAVELFERAPRLLHQSTAKNLFRLHAGYHYPRSPATGRESLDGRAAFLSMFGDALAAPIHHYYAIASSGSLTTPEAFLSHCDALGLGWEIASPPMLQRDAVSLCVRVAEDTVDIDRLRDKCYRLLDAAGVTVRTGIAPDREVLDQFGLRVLATYAGNGQMLEELGYPPPEYQYEFCEVVVADVPRLPRHSFVVMDGPFISLMPHGGHDRFLVYDVDHSVRLRETTCRFELPEDLAALAGHGLVKSPPMSVAASTFASMGRFIAFGAAPRHIGSYFVVRPVLPHADDTDARPTIVRWIDDATVTVLSGKLGTCVAAADAVVASRHASAA
jgi:hypothetical protein